ncbi:MAG: arylsulfatase [Verrucomicrobiales bacterium]
MKPLCRTILLALLAMSVPAIRADDDRPPNLVYLLADDLGYGDLGSYGQQLIRTPRLDEFASEGIRFTQHYAGGPACHPSRGVLFTGLHTGHAYIRRNSKIPLRAEDFTLSQMLKQAGYATGGVGKWALGDHDSTGAPWRKGMDEFFGYLDQTHAHTYYPDFLWKNGERYEIPENAGDNREVYSHDLFADEALDFIRRHADEPFFFYGAFTIPHAEVVVPDDSLDEYRGVWTEPNTFPGSKTYSPQNQPRAVRAGMITRLDRDMGRLFDLLDELGIAEHTLVVFTSDNGPITAGGQDPEFFHSAGPLRGLKFTLYEGGIRVPFLARWPGKIEPGTESDLISDFADMIPTFADAAGIEPPAEFGELDGVSIDGVSIDGVSIDGVSILPTLLGKTEEQAIREHFYWESAPQQALRRGDWKAYRPAPGKPLELYHLASDIGETRDYAPQKPELVDEFERLMENARTESEEFPLEKPKKGGKK